MKTIQMTIDEDLLNRMDRTTRSLGLARSAFIRHAIELALQDLHVKEMEKKQAEGYRRHPVRPGEFDIWNSEQAWGE